MSKTQPQNDQLSYLAQVCQDFNETLPPSVRPLHVEYSNHVLTVLQSQIKEGEVALAEVAKLKSELETLKSTGETEA